MIDARHPVEPEEVMAYLDGELPADRAAETARHVDACPECRILMEELKGVSRKVAEWQVGSSGLAAPPGQVKPRRGWRFAWALGFAGLASVAMFSVFVPRWLETPSRVSALVRDTNEQSTQSRLAEQSHAAQGQQGQGNFSYADMARTKAPMIARTAQIALIATDFAHARERLEAILQSHHGYVGQLTVNTPALAGRTLEAALKVPSGELETSIAELRKLGRVESESQNGEEVTQQYVDLEARLTNARNAEQRLSAVLRQKAGKMDEVLAVEKEITRVRGEIEQMEAERKNLGARVEFATINVRISEEYKARMHPPDSMATRLANAAVAGYRHLADGLMGIAEFGLEYGLSLALWGAILFWPARMMWKKARS